MSGEPAREPRPVSDAEDPPDDWLLLCDPDITEVVQRAVPAALQEPRLSSGRMVTHFEASFARWTGRAQAVAVGAGAAIY